LTQLQQQASHGALGKRANKLDQGILIVRFEMPFHVWCEGCRNLIGRGVRFNAEKKQIGTYHSTKVWSFTMKSPCCKQRLEIHTDPRNAEYIVVSGGKRKTEAGLKEEKQAVVSGEKKEARDNEGNDPLAELEAATDDRRRALETHSLLVALHKDSEANHKEDFSMNRTLRAQMRVKRREEKDADARRQQLGLPDNVRLLPETNMDKLRASAVEFGGGSTFKDNWKKKRKDIINGDIFGGSSSSSSQRAAKKMTKQQLPKMVKVRKDY